MFIYSDLKWNMKWLISFHLIIYVNVIVNECTWQLKIRYEYIF